MPRKESETVPEGNGPIPQQEESGSGHLTLADLYRLFEESFNGQLKIINNEEPFRTTGENVGQDGGGDERDRSAFSKSRPGRSAAMSCHGGKRTSRQEGSRAHGGRRYSSSSDAWG